MDDKNTMDEYEKWMNGRIYSEKEYAQRAILCECLASYRAFKAKDKAVETIDYSKYCEAYRECNYAGRAHPDHNEQFYCPDNVDSKCAITPDKAVEPLAVLADRCSYFISQIAEVGCWRIGLTHYMSNGPANTEKLFQAPTYAAAEAKAREWLNKQEDKK